MKEQKMESPCKNCEMGNSSDCCGAEIIWGDICMECGEHCDTMCEECEFKNIKDNE